MTPPSDAATADEGTTTITLPGGGERVVWSRGGGRPLLMIQGMGGTHDHWGTGLVDALVADGFELITINHRGVYRTPRPEPGYTVADLADDQAAALQVLGIEGPIDVFGISMGGMTAMHLALRHPELVRTLALGCTTAGGAAMTPPAQPDVEALMTAQSSGDMAVAVRAGYEMNLSARVWEDDEMYAEFKTATERAPVQLPVIFTQLQAISTHDVRERLGEISVPTVVMHGTADRVLPYPNAAPVYESIGGAELHSFDDAGHLFFWEDAARCAAILGALSKHPV